MYAHNVHHSLRSVDDKIQVSTPLKPTGKHTHTHTHTHTCARCRYLSMMGRMHHTCSSPSKTLQKRCQFLSRSYDKGAFNGGRVVCWCSNERLVMIFRFDMSTRRSSCNSQAAGIFFLMRIKVTMFRIDVSRHRYDNIHILYEPAFD